VARATWSALAALVALTCVAGLTLCVSGAEGATPVPTAPAASGTGHAAGRAGADACRPAWVTGWQAAAEPAPADPALAGATLRMVVHPQVTGPEVRVRLSNAFGAAPLLVGAVSAARSDGAAGLVSGSARPVAFAGKPEVTIAPGADVVSDPVPLVAEAGRPLAVSLHLPAAPSVITRHAVALQTSYLSTGRGDATFADGAAFAGVPVHSWLVLTGVDVRVPRPVNAVVAVGDSITDGVGSPADANQRWSDALSARLTGTGGAAAMSVLNAGISRNQLLGGGPADGDAPLVRFDRDVASAAAASDVVLHIGTNDIAAGRTAPEIVAGLERFAERARAGGKRVFLTTVTPSASGPHGTRAATATREAVNAWVRARGPEHADGVFDFAAAVADPARPTRLAPAFDAGDGLHLSVAGYRALAAAVDPAQLTGSPCLADTSPARMVVADG
jgi:lysophospholipase L1-like esterase